MNRKSTNNKFRPASLRGPGTARTVLLRMAADQERAERIRALKAERPDLTWRRIGDHVGVSERAASEWKNSGGIEFENAKKLAELFEVDVDYIWRGTDNGTPNPFAGSDATHTLHETLLEIREQNAVILQALQENAEQGKRQRDEILAGLKSIREAIEGRVEESVTGVEHLQHAFDQVLEAIAAPGSLPGAAPDSPASTGKAPRVQSRRGVSSAPR